MTLDNEILAILPNINLTLIRSEDLITLSDEAYINNFTCDP